MVDKDAKSSTGTACKGYKKDGKPCMRRVGLGPEGYCYDHLAQALRTPPPSPAPGPSTPASPRPAQKTTTSARCKGKTKKGDPCMRYSGPSGYCYLHLIPLQTSAPSPALRPSTPAPTSKRTSHTPVDTPVVPSGTGFGPAKVGSRRPLTTYGRRGAMAKVIELYHSNSKAQPGKCCSFMGENDAGCPCPRPVTSWVVEDEIGYCSYSVHAPGDGVLSATRKYIERDNDTVPLHVERPLTTTLNAIKTAALDKLEVEIRNIIRDSNGYDTGYDGILYCFRDHIDALPADLRLNQRPLKCGKAEYDQFRKRMSKHVSNYKNKGREISCVACERFPFIESVDKYVKARLHWWKLPSRGGDGGTEWYYIALSDVQTIWSDARAYALDVARREKQKLNENWYLIPEPFPT